MQFVHRIKTCMEYKNLRDYKSGSNIDFFMFTWNTLIINSSHLSRDEKRRGTVIAILLITFICPLSSHLPPFTLLPRQRPLDRLVVPKTLSLGWLAGPNWFIGRSVGRVRGNRQEQIDFCPRFLPIHYWRSRFSLPSLSSSSSSFALL